MASITMTASLLANSSLAGQPRIAARRSFAVAAASCSKGVKVSTQTNKEGNSNGRRDLMFSIAAAVAASSVSGIAMADEPKPGTPDAKKAYAPVCVTMPTAKICHK